jgi:hypothetical protein
MHYYTIRNGVGTIRVSHLQAQYLVDGEVIHRCRKCSSDDLTPEFHTEDLDGEEITLEDIKALLETDEVKALIREQEIYA